MQIVPSKRSPPLVLGLADDGVSRVSVNDSIRSQHMHVIGATGTGKSRFLLSLIQQDIKAGRGCMLIDPHGELYSHILRWLSNNERLLERRTVRLIDITDQEWSVGFNPLQAPSPAHIPVAVDATVSGLAHALDGSDLSQTPLLARSLSAICTALAYSNLSLVQAPYFLNQQYRRERSSIIKAIPEPIYRQVWDKLEGLSAREYNETFASAERRILPFITDPKLASIIGQNENTLDLKACMDQGEIVLVNLAQTGGRTVSESVKLLGRLLVNNLVSRAYERDPITKPRPVTVYLDEAQQFLSSDVPEILSQCRKYGLHLVLAHQYLEQLRSAGELIYRGVMGTARTKVVFTLDDPDDARIMSERIFAGRIDYEKPKLSMMKPAVVGHQVVRLASDSEAMTHSETYTDGESRTDGQTFTHGHTLTNGWNSTTGTSEMSGVNTSSAVTESSGWSEARSAGRSQANTRGNTYGSNFSTSQGSSISDTLSVVSEPGWFCGPDTVHTAINSGSNQNSSYGHSRSFNDTQSFGTSSSQTHSLSGSHARSQSYGTTQATTQSHSQGKSGSTATSESTADSYSYGTNSSHSQGTAQTKGHGSAETFRPIIEWLPGQLYSMEEQKQQFQDAIVLCPARYAFVAVPGQSSGVLGTLNVPDAPFSATRLSRVQNTLNTQSHYHRSAKEAFEQRMLLDGALKESDDEPFDGWD